MTHYLETVCDDLRDRRRECYKRARQTLNICLGLAIFSAAAIYAVAIFATFDPTKVQGILPELGTLLSVSSSALAYRLYRLENRRAAEIDRDLVRLESARIEYLSSLISPNANIEVSRIRRFREDSLDEAREIAPDTDA